MLVGSRRVGHGVGMEILLRRLGHRTLSWRIVPGSSISAGLHGWKVRRFLVTQCSVACLAVGIVQLCSITVGIVLLLSCPLVDEYVRLAVEVASDDHRWYLDCEGREYELKG